MFASTFRWTLASLLVVGAKGCLGQSGCVVKVIQGQWAAPAMMATKPTITSRVGDGTTSPGKIMRQLASQGAAGSAVLAKLAVGSFPY